MMLHTTALTGVAGSIPGLGLEVPALPKLASASLLHQCAPLQLCWPSEASVHSDWLVPMLCWLLKVLNNIPASN